MMRNIEPLAGGTAAAPLIRHARQSGAVEANGTLRLRAQSAHVLVVQDQAGERRDRDEQPLRRKCETSETQPRHDQK